MKLIFIRHGQATAYCADDMRRDLTEFGQTQAKETGTHLADRHSLDMIITSPFIVPTKLPKSYKISPKTKDKILR